MTRNNTNAYTRKYCYQSCITAGPRLWNSLPDHYSQYSVKNWKLLYFAIISGHCFAVFLLPWWSLQSFLHKLL